MSLQRQVLIWVALFGVLLYTIYALSNVLLPFLAGLAIGYFLDPLATKLEQLGLNRLGATVLIMALTLAVLLAIGIVVLPILAHQLTAFVLNLPAITTRLQDLLSAQASRLVETYAGEMLRKFGIAGPLTTSDVQSSIGNVVGQATSYAIAFINQLWSSSRALFGIVSVFVITPVVAFYILLDWKRMVASVDDWVPIHHREDVRRIARDVDRALAGFVRGQTILSLILGTWYATGLTLSGLNFGFLIGFVGGFFSFVPYFGSLTVMIVAASVAAVQGWPDWHLVALSVGTVMIGQVMEGYVLGPVLVGNSIGLHPVWIMISLVVCSTVLGVTGLVMAVPLAAMIGVLARYALRQYLASPLYTGEPEHPVIPFESRSLRTGAE